MFELILLVVLGTSLWVLFDSRAIGVEKGRITGFFDMGRAGWFLSCLGLWIVAFPAYLAKRDEYKRMMTATDEQDEQLDDVQAADIPSQIANLFELKTQGLLSEEEFQTKKTELLARM
jgi:hypothetical protein